MRNQFLLILLGQCSYMQNLRWKMLTISQLSKLIVCLDQIFNFFVNFPKNLKKFLAFTYMILNKFFVVSHLQYRDLKLQYFMIFNLIKMQINQTYLFRLTLIFVNHKCYYQLLKKFKIDWLMIQFLI